MEGLTALCACFDGRYLGAVFALVVTAGDGIVFWAPIFIHNMIDKDSSSGNNSLQSRQEVLGNFSCKSGWITYGLHA